MASYCRQIKVCVCVCAPMHVCLCACGISTQSVWLHSWMWGFYWTTSQGQEDGWESCRNHNTWAQQTCKNHTHCLFLNHLNPSFQCLNKRLPAASPQHNFFFSFFSASNPQQQAASQKPLPLPHQPPRLMMMTPWPRTDSLVCQLEQKKEKKKIWFTIRGRGQRSGQARVTSPCNNLQ